MKLQNKGLREVQAVLLPSMGVQLSQDQLEDETHEPNVVIKTEQSEAIEKGETETQHSQSQSKADGRVLSSAPDRHTSSSISTTNTAEFIPHLFYSLHQIRKDPNSSANQLETSTAFIKHRLKNCKSLIANNDDCKRLLSKTTEEWHEYIQNREKELEVKRKVLKDLKNKIATLQDTQ